MYCLIYFILLGQEAREVNVVNYWLNAEEILAPGLCGPSGACPNCGLSVDQATACSGIFFCIQQSFRYMFMTPCFNRLY